MAVPPADSSGRPESPNLASLIGRLAERTGKQTQSRQAEALGVSDSSLSGWLNGTRTPSEPKLLEMLTRVGVPQREHALYLDARRRAAIAQTHVEPEAVAADVAQPSATAVDPIDRPTVGATRRGWLAWSGAGVALLLAAGALAWMMLSGSPPPTVTGGCDLYVVTAKDLALRTPDGTETGPAFKRGEQLTVVRRSGPAGHTYWLVRALDGRQGWVLPDARWWRAAC
jgi:transcriptional regulator with XRE-family HTH domain